MVYHKNDINIYFIIIILLYIFSIFTVIIYNISNNSIESNNESNNESSFEETVGLLETSDSETEVIISIDENYIVT